MTSKKRTILITGCSEGGAGNDLAMEFFSRGFRVFATARNLKSAANLEAKGIETLELDITKPKSILAAKSEIARRTGGTLDILFNNAGMLYVSPAIEADPLEVRKLYNANVFGLFEMVTAFTPLLIAAVPASSHPPTIVNIASVLARLPGPFTSAYNSSKAAVASYSDTLRLELEPIGIKVKTVYMGEVATRIMARDNVYIKADSIYACTESKIKERTEKTGNFMKPANFARQVFQEVVHTNHSYIWKGSSAFIVWLLNAIGPMGVFDRAMRASLGLDNGTTKNTISEAAQRTLKQ